MKSTKHFHVKCKSENETLLVYLDCKNKMYSKLSKANKSNLTYSYIFIYISIEQIIIYVLSIFIKGLGSLTSYSVHTTAIWDKFWNITQKV